MITKEQAINKDPKFYLKDGSLTLYALCCGYIDVKKFNIPETIEVRLEKDGCYHVKVWEHTGKVSVNSLVWKTYDSLTEARRAFKRQAQAYKRLEEANKIFNSME